MPVIQAPAGATLAGEKIGGRFLSATQIRSGQVLAAPGTVVTLQSRIPMIVAGLQIRMHTASEETAEEIAELASQMAPVDTGALADSIHTVELDIVGDWAVVSDVRYAPYVEFGTARRGFNDAQPYMIPAVEMGRQAHIHNVTASLQGL